MQVTEQNTTPTKNKNAIYTYQPNDNFCSELKKLRERKHLSQSDFAKDLHISITSVQNWENGRRFPNDYSCALIISKFSLTEEEASLLFIVEEKTSEEEVAASEISDEDANLERTSAKPLITIFKEKWLKIRKPFVIGVGVWIVAWIGIILWSLVACFKDNSTENSTEILSCFGAFFVIDWNELILYCIISLFAIVTIFIIVYIIIRKVRKR